MKINILILILMQSVFCYTQNIKIVDYKSFKGFKENTYFVNSDCDKYIGEWVYTNRNESVKINLKKVKLDYSRPLFKNGPLYKNCYMDNLIIYFEYKINNKIIYSNYESLKRPLPTVFDIEKMSNEIFLCFANNSNLLTCSINDKPKKRPMTLYLTINKDWDKLVSENSRGTGGFNIYSEDDEIPLDGFTFPDNMTLKKVK